MGRKARVLKTRGEAEGVKKGINGKEIERKKKGKERRARWDEDKKEEKN